MRAQARVYIFLQHITTTFCLVSVPAIRARTLVRSDRLYHIVFVRYGRPRVCGALSGLTAPWHTRQACTLNIYYVVKFARARAVDHSCAALHTHTHTARYAIACNTSVYNSVSL